MLNDRLAQLRIVEIVDSPAMKKILRLLSVVWGALAIVVCLPLFVVMFAEMRRRV